jgi:hypothetical protein
MARATETTRGRQNGGSSFQQGAQNFSFVCDDIPLRAPSHISPHVPPSPGLPFSQALVLPHLQSCILFSPASNSLHPPTLTSTRNLGCPPCKSLEHQNLRLLGPGQVGPLQIPSSYKVSITLKVTIDRAFDAYRCVLLSRVHSKVQPPHSRVGPLHR